MEKIKDSRISDFVHNGAKVGLIGESDNRLVGESKDEMVL